MREGELREIEQYTAAATPGPWFVRTLDDDHAMNLVAVSTVEDTGKGERWPDFDHAEIIAATLVQQPRYVDAADERWDEPRPSSSPPTHPEAATATPPPPAASSG